VSFDDAAIATIIDKVVSYALASNRFELVNGHEPKSAPGNGLTCAVWVQDIRPIRTSGLAATSGFIRLQARIYTSFVGEPADLIDPNVAAAASDLIGALTLDFDLGGDADVRAVDLLGMSGETLSAQAGYIEIDRKMYRVMTINVPIIINDMWAQV